MTTPLSPSNRSGLLASPPASGRAIVIGAGMGGLLAARVLADHYVDVVLVERDTLAPFPQPRKGVPHGRHVHGFLARGCATVERLFPGMLNDFATCGASTGDALEVVRWFHGGGYHARGTAGFSAVIASRTLLEQVVRTHLLRLPNVRMLDGTGVDDLLWDQDGTRVVGVRISGAAISADGTIPAGLVVDASGRGSRLPAWLEQRGFPAPEVSNIEIGIRYATRTFRRRPDHLPGTLLAASVAAPNHPRGGLMLAIEDDRWMVSISGRHGEQPPTDLAGFIDFAGSLQAPDIHDLVRDAEPLDTGATYGFQRSTWRHYERLERLPEGIVPVADSVCSFNPIYGQGMTVAALEAVTLGACLDARTDSLAARFLAAVQPLVDGVWRLSTTADLRFSTDANDIPPQAQQMNAYLDRVHVAARGDVEVARAFCAVMHLMSPPDLLRSPDIAARVMAASADTGPATAYRC